MEGMKMKQSRYIIHLVMWYITDRINKLRLRLGWLSYWDVKNRW